ncbi:hypothetical protein [Sandaracinus amylolyticus]|uniref:hypothetical protein n=1 Tax=Sandaracinus amylolyticus TaxID=927083 RepID=UPI001F19673E|nr:hypothetical protein [Sandaracinus amylolyticus]UJR84282.1 Hypothetical protein I5071_63600 [Sandaracinus amylolyticus]
MDDSSKGDADELRRAIVRDAAETKAAGEVVGNMKREFILQVLGAVAAAGGAAMGGPLGLLAGPAATVFLQGLFAAVERHDVGRKALDALSDSEAIAALAARIEEIDERLRSLEPTAKAGDVAAVLAMYLDAARSSADDEKRRILTNAVVNAFDAKQYREGLTRRLFAILSQMEYPEIYLLRRIEEKARPVSARGRWEKDDRMRLRPWYDARALDSTLASRLVDLGLILRLHPLGEPHLPESSPDTADTTMLGERLLALVADRATNRG